MNHWSLEVQVIKEYGGSNMSLTILIAIVGVITGISCAIINNGGY